MESLREAFSQDVRARHEGEPQTNLKELHAWIKENDPGFYSRIAKMRTAFRKGMPRREVVARLSAASRMVSPENMKFLPKEVQERTGLEVNPLWYLECLVRSGTLDLKQQVTSLINLAKYTHSQAPSVQHNLISSPEAWLEALAEEYPTVEIESSDAQKRKEGTLPKRSRPKRIRHAVDAEFVDVPNEPKGDSGS